MHLRLDADGHGTLIVNANRIMHLNPTAALMAYLLLEGKPENEAVTALTRRYRIGYRQARADLQAFDVRLSTLIRPDGACPIHDLELEVTAPFSARPSAPYRLDLALTYRCNNDCAHCYNQRISDSTNQGFSDSADQRIGPSQLLTPNSYLAPPAPLHAPRELSTADW
ncbi:MAG: hypothetical protein C0393_07360, partial [Anaerolinea sp.]|nr:hypothetical protein [Anaerolinea sp.]